MLVKILLFLILLVVVLMYTFQVMVNLKTKDNQTKTLQSVVTIVSPVIIEEGTSPKIEVLTEKNLLLVIFLKNDVDYSKLKIGQRITLEVQMGRSNQITSLKINPHSLPKFQSL